MLDKFECAHMNDVKLIKTGVGGHIVLFCIIFRSSKTRICCTILVVLLINLKFLSMFLVKMTIISLYNFRNGRRLWLLFGGIFCQMCRWMSSLFGLLLCVSLANIVDHSF